MRNWILWLLIGIITILGGVFALFNPFAATLAATTLAAWVFIIAGALQLVGVFQTEGWGARIWGLILALAFIWLGISILGNPLAGMMSLTIVAGIMFIATGIAKIIFAFRIRGSGYFIWAILSGIVSLILGFMVFTNFPYSAAVVLGVLLAVELISSGITLVTFALLLKNSPRRLAALTGPGRGSGPAARPAPHGGVSQPFPFGNRKVMTKRAPSPSGPVSGVSIQ
jgi:uncharacterized membrane protein HdeD (DUF308 family)